MSHAGTWDQSIAFSPNSTSAEIKIVSGTDSGMIKLWTIENLADENPSVSFHLIDSDAVYSLDWSPDDSMIVAGGNGDITVYDAGTREILFQELNAHTGRVNDVAFSTDSSKIASGGNDGTLKLWQAPVPAACSLDIDCEDFNDCTTDLCVGSVCQNTSVSDDNSCNDGDGICCSGSCDTAACIFDSDCDDGGNLCTTDTCTSGGLCAAACDNSFPACDLNVSDGCCGPSCDQNNDFDCCVPTHSKEKGPRCSDGLDNDCDHLIDGADPDC